MGLKCLSIDPGEVTPASQIADSVVGALDDSDKVAEVFRQCEKVTLENEFIPASSIREALKKANRDESCLTPGTDCLEMIQDKLSQRRAYAEKDAPSPIAVPLEGDGKSAEQHIGYPMVLKARFGGYDGKGTRYAHTEMELEAYKELWGKADWMAEAFIDFTRELAVMVCRSEKETVCFPTMETVQTDHVCDLVYPSGTDASLAAIQAVEAVGGYGLFGVELFETEDEQFLINEVAPRPHNTGHYTLDWGGTSQFEAHVRLVMGLPVGQLIGDETCMANLLGQDGANDYRAGLRSAIKRDPGVHVHWYGKADSRVGRKMGHLNVTGEDCINRAEEARERFYEAWCKGS